MLDKFKCFTVDEAEKWGEQHFRTWLPQLHSQDHDPQTDLEQFFRYYTQGTGHIFNRILRNGIESFDFSDSFFTEAMFIDSIAEIKKHKLSEDIVVFRYIQPRYIERMLEWGGSRTVKKESILSERGFLSTTLSPEAVRDQPYASKGNTCFKIYVPKGTPCVYVDLISDMHEQEMLFPPDTKLKVLKSSLFKKSIECIVI